MLSYDDLGRGQTIVLLHGFCENKSLWKGFEENLAEEYRVINVDLPGFGDTPLLESNISIDWYAEQINDLLEELNIEKVVIIGHSLGGYVGLAFAKLYEEKILGLGLIHSNVFADTEERIHTRNKTLTFLERIGIERFINIFVPPLFFDNNTQQKNIEQVIEMGVKTSLHTALEVTKAMRDRPSYKETLQQLQIPVLFVVGKEDMTVPYKVSEEQIHLAQKSIIEILEDVGHMGMYENPKKVDSAIKKLLLSSFF